MALRDIPNAPDSYAYAARTGDDMTEMQRRNLHLTVGVDVSPLTKDAMPRPADDAERVDWQNFAVVQGVPYEEAVNLDRAELMERLEVQETPEAPSAGGSGMPAETDLKAAWIDYAASEIFRGTAGQVTMEQGNERASAATKAELIAAFGPNATPEARSPFLVVEQPEGVIPEEGGS
jgi:hypothetical protein